MTAIEKQGYAARQAARQLAVTTTEEKNQALEAIARALLARQGEVLSANFEEGDQVEKDQVLAWIGDTPVRASLTGVLRGMIRDGFTVPKGMKIADIDPRKEQKKNCFTISDKARCIAGSVLEILLSEGVMPYEAPGRFSGITAD